MEKINWGILGLGDIAHTFSKGFIETSNAKLLAVSSKDNKKLNKFKDEFNIDNKFLFDDYEDLITCKEVDVVYIALPNFLHHHWAIKSIKNKKHVLVEKPVTLNLEEIKDIKINLNDEKIFFGEAFMYRYHPQIDTILEIIKNNDIGNLINMKSLFGTNLLSKKKFWFFNKKKKIDPNSRLFNKKLGGGCILDLGCYTSSLSLLISSLTSKKDIPEIKLLNIYKEMGETNVDVDASAKIIFDESFFSEIYASFKKDLGRKTEIHGDRGSIVINDSWFGSKSILKKDCKGEQIISLDNIKKSIYSYQIENISKVILNKVYQPKFPGISLNESIVNMKIIEEWQNA